MLKRNVIILIIILGIIPLITSSSLYTAEGVINGSWYFEQDNTMQILTKDLNGTLIDVNNINFSIIENINFSSKIERKDVGKYFLFINMNSSNFSEINLNLTVIEDSKIISNSYAIEINKKSWIDKTKKNYFGWLESKFDSIIFDFENYALTFIIFLFVVLTLVVFSYIFYRRRTHI